MDGNVPEKKRLITPLTLKNKLRSRAYGLVRIKKNPSIIGSQKLVITDHIIMLTGPRSVTLTAKTKQVAMTTESNLAGNALNHDNYDIKERRGCCEGDVVSQKLPTIVELRGHLQTYT
jgi:hypothetical protein